MTNDPLAPLRGQAKPAQDLPVMETAKGRRLWAASLEQRWNRR
jgi:hypothetical protein